MAKGIDFMCTFCYGWFRIDLTDLGAENVECPDCGCDNFVPETEEGVIAQNKECREEDKTASLPSHFRIMLLGEDGVESCLKNGVPAEYADLVAEGFQTHYTEGGKVYTEPELTVADHRRMAMHISDDYHGYNEL